MANGNEGSTSALGDAQARKLLDAPPDDTLKGVRYRAILATLALSRHAPRGTVRVADPGHPEPSGGEGQIGFDQPLRDHVRGDKSDVAALAMLRNIPRQRGFRSR
jgi:hypothetical protein